MKKITWMVVLLVPVTMWAMPNQDELLQLKQELAARHDNTKQPSYTPGEAPEREMTLSKEELEYEETHAIPRGNPINEDIPQKAYKRKEAK